MSDVLPTLKKLERRQQDMVLTYEDQTHSIQFDATGRLVDDMTTWLDAAIGE